MARRTTPMVTTTTTLHRHLATCAVLTLALFLIACPSKSDCVSVRENARACEANSAPANIPAPPSRYPTHTGIIASVFWVGETGTAENDFIENHTSAWDPSWEAHFGGVDAPPGKGGGSREGYCQCDFVPGENPFYVALPYNDLDPKQDRKPEVASLVPWFENALPLVEESQSVLKNRWVEVSIGDRRCYGQWEDVGPALEDDGDYVFGTARPKNTFGLKAGIDLSPAMTTCLGIVDVGTVNWRFIDPADVPNGPWIAIVSRPR